jgi:hypothetical protein
VNPLARLPPVFDVSLLASPPRDLDGAIEHNPAHDFTRDELLRLRQLPYAAIRLVPVVRDVVRDALDHAPVFFLPRAAPLEMDQGAVREVSKRSILDLVVCVIAHPYGLRVAVPGKVSPVVLPEALPAANVIRHL